MPADIKLKVPSSAKKGEVIEIKCQVIHDMESGQRKDAAGKTLPKRIINKMVMTWNGETVTSADWYPSMSKDPFVTLYAVASESGTVKLTFHDDNGEKYEASRDISVS